MYKHGFWKGGEEGHWQAELEMLDTVEGGELTEGTIEDDDGNDGPGKASSNLVRHWVHIARCTVNLARTIEGFNWTDNTCAWRVEGKLSEDRVECKEIRCMDRQWVDDVMDVNEGNADNVSE